MVKRGALPLLIPATLFFAAVTLAAGRPVSVLPVEERAVATGPATAEPPLSVMLVETQRVRRWLGHYYPPDMDPNDIPWSGFIEMRVRVLEHLMGRNYSAHSNMIYVAHAAYIPGVRLLVIAEPRTDARGFFVRWYTGADEHGEYCAPTELIDAQRVRRAFMTARLARREDRDFLCVQGRLFWRSLRRARR